ncbi:MAG: hypothetical protein HZR80_02195 [Candidatus Heimdallarchaeota archaeon]
MDFLSQFPLKRSQLAVYLHKAIKAKIVRYKKQKYSLNLNHILVQRLWNYFISTKNKHVGTSKIIIRNIPVIQKQNELKKQLEHLNLNLEKGHRQLQKRDLKEFCDDLFSILSSCNDKDSIIDLCERYRHLLVGI